jgi:hypothetical protein
VTDAAGLSTTDSSKIFPDCSSGRIALALKNFSVTPEDGVNKVKWMTEMAPQIENFELERSADGIHFFTIHHQLARNEYGISEYGFPDNNFPDGTNYYRLRMNEIGDIVRYSAVIKVVSEAKEQEIIISPNPVTGNFSVQYSAPDNGAVIITVSDMTGRPVTTFHETVNKGQNIIYLQNRPSWKPGMYLVTVQQGNVSKRGKMLYQ